MIKEFVMNHVWSTDRKMRFINDVRRNGELCAYGYSIPDNYIKFSYKNINWKFPIY